MIIDAIRLITNKADVNIAYREELTKGHGSVVEFLGTAEGIISIAVPAVAGKLGTENKSSHGKIRK